jgi:RNA polymerase sigma factor for flagellar operon FliA
MEGRERDPKELDALWAEYRRNRSESAREQLILAYVHLVRTVADRLAIGLPSNVDVDDLFGAGVVGLMQAIEKFDPDRNAKFESYAVPRIRGAMLDELRAQDWFPRSLRKKARLLEQAYADVEGQLGRTATDAEIAEHLKIPIADYYELVDEVCLATLVSLDREIANCTGGLYAVVSDELATPSVPDPSEALEEQELHELLREIVDGMPEKERLVLTLYYFEELTLKEIGEVLGISESRVCQIHTKAVMRLRGRFLDHLRTVSIRRLAEEVRRARRKKVAGERRA